MSAATQPVAQVVSQGTDVGAFAATDDERNFGQREFCYFVTAYMDDARFARNFLPLACKLIQLLAVYLFRGKHWWGLILVAQKILHDFGNHARKGNACDTYGYQDAFDSV